MLIPFALALGAFVAPVQEPGSSTELYTFYPAGGRVNGDLWFSFFVDLDPTVGGTLDYECGALAPDGHDASDAIIRTFDEQDIGVPVYAALDGVVTATHDGEFDKEVAGSGIGKTPNSVTIDHGNGRIAHYWHLKQWSVSVSVGQTVAAGEPIGMVGSSGPSSWPHLHFATYDQGVVYEPFSGPCRPGPSGWENQWPLLRNFQITDVATSWEPPTTNGGVPYGLPRSGEIAISDPTSHLWVMGSNLPAFSDWRVELEDPNGSVAFDSGTTPFGIPFELRFFWFEWDYDVPQLQGTIGTWRYRLWVNGAIAVEAPFELVPSRTGLNRAPEAISAALVPAQPVAGDVLLCEVGKPPVHDDLDYDVLRYRYEWFVNGAPVRAVTSAGEADALARDLYTTGDTVQCNVTVSDGKIDGNTTTAYATVGGAALSLAPPTPGIAGQTNTLVASGGTAGATTYFVYGTAVGTTAVPTCAGLESEIHQAKLAGIAVVDALGDAALSAPVPASIAGAPLLLQAFEIASCSKSNLLMTVFR